MKSIIIAMALLCFAASTAFAQKINEDQVPATVVSNFKKQFAKAIKPKWEMEDADFEVNFKDNGSEYSAKYDKQGNWLETEQEIKSTEIPAIIKQGIEKEFPGFKTDEVEKVNYPDNKTVYEMEVEKGKEEFEVQFSSDGKMLKKEVKDKKEKKD